MENIPHLDADTLQLDMSSKGRYSVPIKNLEVGRKEHTNQWQLIPMLTFFLRQLISAFSESQCQSVPCPDTWKQWPNQLNMLQPCQLYWP